MEPLQFLRMLQFRCARFYILSHLRYIGWCAVRNINLVYIMIFRLFRGLTRAAFTSHLIHTPTQIINFVSSPVIFVCAYDGYLSYRRIWSLYSRHKTYCPTCVRTTLVHVIRAKVTHLVCTTWCPVWEIQAEWSPPFATHTQNTDNVHLRGGETRFCEGSPATTIGALLQR